MSAINPFDLDKKHYINVNPYGTFEDYKPLLAGPELSKVKTSYIDVDLMFDHFNQHNVQHIALFFHGGLVGEKNGMEAAERFHRFYNGQHQLHTISFVWETGILTSLIEHFKGEIDDAFFKSVVKKAGAKIMDKLGIEVPGLSLVSDHLLKTEKKTMNLMAAENFSAIQTKSIHLYEKASLEEIEADLMADEPHQADLQLYAQSLDQSTIKNVNGFWPSPMSLALAAIKVAARCIYRFVRNRNHAVTATLLEEVYRQLKPGVSVEKTAIGVWDEMKEQADKMWRPNKNRKKDKQYAGRYFLDKLSAYVKAEQSKGNTVKIELVGHSAGSIAICELFDLLKKEQEAYAHLNFNTILFMAPACKCDLFDSTILPMQHRFKRFKMFTMYQEAEEQDTLVDVPYLKWLYPMSLLYFVSGLCEDGDKWFDEDVKGDTCILGLEQHVGGTGVYSDYEVLKRVHEFLYKGGEYQNNIALVPSKPGAPPGYRGQARDHGYFDNDGEDQLEGSIKESMLYWLGQ